MNKRQKILIAVASLILTGIYFTPLWKITLDAPQYPEGLGLYIWVNKISGENQHDLRTINGLNHYIGMKEITPESIPELKIMPYFVGFLIITGFIVAFVGNRKVLGVWAFIFFAVLIAGLIDFYLWEYDYGHNLNPHAAIKIPGMSYQPPLIGSKQLLNMHTTSLPSIGGILAGLSFLITLYVLFVSRKNMSITEEKNHVAVKPIPGAA